MKKLFSILIVCVLSFPAIAVEGQDTSVSPVSTQSGLEAVQPEEAADLNNNKQVEEQDVIPAESLPSQYKEPYSKKKIAMKFIIAMLCVAGCSIFLYGSLTLYNKIRDAVLSSSNPVPPEGEKQLDAPEDLTEAVKTFIDKTKWDN